MQSIEILLILSAEARLQKRLNSLTYTNQMHFTHD